MADPRRFFPTLNKAKAAGLGLPAKKPRAQHRGAGLVVTVKGVLREVWSERTTMTLDEIRRLDRVVPEKAVAGRLYHVLGRELSRRGPFVKARVDHYTDRALDFWEGYLPKELSKGDARAHVETAFEALINGRKLPEVLRVRDLTSKRSGGGAYRATRVKRQPDFHGYQYGDAIKRATSDVNRLFRRGPMMSGEIRAYAWPVLWLLYGDSLDPNPPELLLVVDPEEKLHAIDCVADMTSPTSEAILGA